MSERPRIVLASRNPGKIAELQRILASADLDVEVVGSEAFADLPDIRETGQTFADNAALKAETVGRHTGLIAIADDSGLTVDALNGMPGILSARWSGRDRDDDANVDLVLDQMSDVPDDLRTAAFRCAAAAFRPGTEPRLEVREAEVRGVLLRQRRGIGGFGYDPVFLPDGHALTTAEMEPAEKDAISHRGRALRDLISVIRPWFG